MARDPLASIQRQIEAIVTKRISHQEALLRQFMLETGLTTFEIEVVEQRSKDGSEVRWYFRRRE